MLISQSEIIDIFKSCGFEKVGIASPQIAEIYKRAIEQWAKNKQHGTMQWFENNLEKRTNPHVLESWVKSIVVVAKNYYPGRANENKNGKTSNYAWGKDYHKILKTQLKTAIEKIKILCPQIKTRAFVDSAPVMERTLATQSGLGFIGKNTMLITEEFGSWVFLGTVFTNLELSPTAPENKFNYCGDISMYPYYNCYYNKFVLYSICVLLLNIMGISSKILISKKRYYRITSKSKVVKYCYFMPFG